MTEDLIAAYFLGGLSEAESRRLEEDCLREEGRLDQLRSAEESLIDAYVRGELGKERKERFERHYLITEARRQTVSVASALREKYNASSIYPVGKSPISHSALSHRRSPNALIWTSAIAAVILLAAAAGLWTLWRRNQSASFVTQTGNVAPSTQTKPLAGSSPDPRGAPTGTTSSTATPIPKGSDAPRNAPTPSTPTTPRPSALATFALLPGGVRSEGDGGTTLDLRPSVAIARLELVLKQDDFKRYRGELQTTEGAVLYRKEGLSSRVAGTRRTVTFEVPAHLLEDKHYVLILYGEEAGSANEPAAEYVFRVRRK